MPISKRDYNIENFWQEDFMPIALDGSSLTIEKLVAIARISAKSKPPGLTRTRRLYRMAESYFNDHIVNLS